MFRFENGHNTFVPRALKYAQKFVRRGALRNKIRNLDVSQIGGNRLAPALDGYTRLLTDVLMFSTPAEYAALDGLNDPTRALNATKSVAMTQDELDGLKSKLTSTSIDGVYAAIWHDIRVDYEDSVTAEEIEKLQVSLRPPKALTPAELIALPAIQARVIEASNRSRIATEMVAAIVKNRANTDEAFRKSLGGVVDDATRADIDEFDVSVEDIRDMNIAVFNVMTDQLRTNELGAMTREAFEIVRFTKVVAANMSPEIILSLDYISDHVAVAQAEHRISSFKAPEWLEKYEGTKTIDSPDLSGTSTLNLALFDMRKPSARAPPGQEADLTVELGDDVHPDVRDAINANIRRAYRESRIRDGIEPRTSGNEAQRVHTFPRGRFHPNHRGNQDADEDAHHYDFNHGNADERAKAFGDFYPAGAASYGQMKLSFQYVRGRDIDVDYDGVEDEFYGMKHYVLAVANSEQVLDENDRFLFGYTRASNVMDGYCNDPGDVFHNVIEGTFTIQNSMPYVTEYMTLYGEPEIMEMARQNALLSTLKGGHKSTTADMDNVLDKQLGAMGKSLGDIGKDKTAVFNLVNQHGMHTASQRMLFGDLLYLASQGQLSDVVRKRLNPDGPLLSGPRNVYRAFLQIEASQFFEILGDTDTPRKVHAAMARINDVGHRMVPYAAYFYGETAMVPQGAIDVLMDAAIYAASFREVLPGSTITRSIAMTRAADAAQANDIVVRMKVVAFVRAYRRAIEQHTGNRLRVALKLDTRALT